MHQVHILISGKVQGVFFRQHIADIAHNLAITGWVKNNKTQVEAVLQGNQTDIEELIKYCKKGPQDAKVSDVKVTPQEVKEMFENFKVVS